MSICSCPISHGRIEHTADCFKNPNNFEYQAPRGAQRIDYRELAESRYEEVVRLQLQCGRAEKIVLAARNFVRFGERADRNYYQELCAALNLFNDVTQVA